MISVAMATYNGELYIEQQLDSIFRQTMPIDELIIVDDQSKDNTVQVVNKYIKSHKDKNIYFYENEVNLGYKKNFREAVSKCKGDYIFLCDQDDVWKDNKVEVMIQTMKEHPNIMVLASSFEQINPKNELIPVQLLKNYSNNNLYWHPVKKDDLVKVEFDEICIQNFFQGCATVMNKQIQQEFLSSFTDELFHDWLINLLAAKYDGLWFLNMPLFQYRIHEKNTIGIQESEHYSPIGRLIRTSTLENRIYRARYASKTIGILLEHDKNLIKAQPEIMEKKAFYEEHIEVFRKAKFGLLVKQNRSPYIKNLKTNKARVMDFVFVLLKKLGITHDI